LRRASAEATDSPVSIAVELATARRIRARDAGFRAALGFAWVLALVSAIPVFSVLGWKRGRRSAFVDFRTAATGARRRSVA
jgi:hypothetical protein